MPWYNPASWFRRRRLDSEADRLGETGADFRCSRRAVDSGEFPMDAIFSMRIPHELRILGARQARMHGLSLSEYMRVLLARAVDEANVEDGGEPCVLRKRGRG